jgi:hypothetical protein
MNVMQLFETAGLFLAICLAVAAGLTAVMAGLSALEPRPVPALVRTTGSRQRKVRRPG